MPASKAGKRIARAFERAEARHQITDPGVELPFDVLLRDALVEVQVELGLRNERDRRRIRKAARRLHAADEVLARIPSIAAAAEAAPAAAAPAGRPPPGPPAWHPEHRLNSDS